MRIRFGLLAVLVTLVFSGCASSKSKTPPPNAVPGTTASTPGNSNHQLIITPGHGLNGKVSAVNLNLRFVVLTFPIGQMANFNQHLYLYRHGLKVGEVNVTGPQQDDSIVADIVAGDAAKGDEVRDR